MAKYEIRGRHGRLVEDDDDDILPDGGRMRVSMMARDSMSELQRSVMADKAARMFDDSAARHQAGPVTLTDEAARAARREAYLDAKRELGDAWRHAVPGFVHPADAGDGRRRRRGIARDPFGREVETWEEEEDAAPAVPRVLTADEGRRLKQQAYEAMVADMCNAWKDPR
jgi:hypothetical protein